MKLKIWDTCDCGCEQRDYFIFETKYFKVRWFYDYGDWFCYFYLGKRYWRFSSSGFVKGRMK